MTTEHERYLDRIVFAKAFDDMFDKNERAMIKALFSVTNYNLSEYGIRKILKKGALLLQYSNAKQYIAVCKYGRVEIGTDGVVDMFYWNEEMAAKLQMILF